MNKDVRQLLEEAVERGLTVKEGKKHLKVFGSEGLVTVLSKGTKMNPRNQRQAELAVRKAKP